MTSRTPIRGLFAAFFLALLCSPAVAQFSDSIAANKCYRLQSDPPSATTSIGQRVDFDLSVRREAGCRAVAVDSWQFSSPQPHLEITVDPLPGKEVGVRPLDGAFADSSITAKADLRDALTFEYAGTIGLQIAIDVEDGAVLPDLAIRDIEIAPNIIEDRPFLVTASLVNEGDGPTTTHTLGSFSVENLVNKSTLCPPLEPGESCQLSFESQIYTTGTFAYELCGDQVGAIDELDENNNCAGGNITVGPASQVDLSADGLVVSPDTPPAGQPTLVTAVARNIGAVPSGAFAIRLETPSGVLTQSCPGLAPLANCSRSFTWEPEANGEATLRMEIIYSGPEDDIQNNSLERTVTVEGFRRPDFIVAVGDIGMSPADPQVGEDITFTVAMTNIGFRWSSGWYNPTLLAQLGGESFSTICRPILDTGESCEFSFTTRVDEPGVYTLDVTADIYNAVYEVNETNNGRQLNFVVDDNSGDVTCQGQWTLTGTQGTNFSTTAPGSVIDGCLVFFGQNSPISCWQTVGDEGLEASWYRAPGTACPSSVTVSDPNPPYETWHFSVSIH